MESQIPPLTALKCFEIAARRKSFTQAADELCLTPSAVSHQIKILETFVGIQLFIRSGRSMLLTDPGAAYFGRIHAAFEEIIGATRALSGARRAETLKISVAPSFADAWLMPRLAWFIRANRDLQIQVFTNLHPTNFGDTTIDCEIRYGHGKWLALTANLLLEEHVVPLCSPDLLGRQPSLEEPQDVIKHTLIYTDSRQVTWDTWARRFRLSGLDHASHFHVDRSSLALEAASAGLGIALESDVLANRELERGDLIAPLGLISGSEEAYYLVYPRCNEKLDRVQIFQSWLIEALVEKRRLRPTERITH
jgi:LysR family transcriptional regulator, glycine cleavage system transcriptional activator